MGDGDPPGSGIAGRGSGGAASSGSRRPAPLRGGGVMGGVNGRSMGERGREIGAPVSGVAEEGGQVVVVELGSLIDPADACARLRALPYPMLLESVARSGEAGRHSFLVCDPFLLVRSKDGRVEAKRGGGQWRPVDGSGPDPFAILQRLLSRFRMPSLPGLPPFQGGLAGYFGYDLLHHLERVPAPAHDDLALPDLFVGFYDWVLAWDHEAGRCVLVSTGLPFRGARARRRAVARARAVQRLLAEPGPDARDRAARAFLEGDDAPPPPSTSPPRHPIPEFPGVRSTCSPDDFRRMVARTRDYILAGDLFQANISHRLEVPWAGDPFELYLRVRASNPADFAAYLDLGPGAGAVVSASPERFLYVTGREVETRPIKGTLPRGRTPAEDAELAAALQASPKDRAENIMIVDLLRNDLSRVCEDDSVQAEALCALEHHPTVHHLVSIVTGRLRPDVDAVDLLRAAFPGGSITGAPKIRAMQVIAELEPTRRGVYTGAVGYIGFDGGMDTNVAIRTMVVRRGVAYLQVGCGVVLDSDPDREYAESLAKARGLLAALEACS